VPLVPEEPLVALVPDELEDEDCWHRHSWHPLVSPFSSQTPTCISPASFPHLEVP
jgi:hypothetical protein